MSRIHTRASGRRNPRLRGPRDTQEASGQAQALQGLPTPQHHQGRLQRWAEGAAQIDVQMAAARYEPHAMVPMGRRAPFDDICEVCGVGRDDRLQPGPGRTTGKRVHW